MDTRPGKSSLFRKYPRRGAWVVTMYLASLVLFVIAIFLPFTSVTKLWVFDNQISVIRGLIILWHSDEIFLFLILFVFTVAFPFVKINTMLVLWLNDENMSLCTPDPFNVGRLLCWSWGDWVDNRVGFASCDRPVCRRT